MNHSRTNPPIRFCPTCGEKFNTQIHVHCDDTKHKARRKDRSLYCCDCGIELAKMG